MYLALVFTHRLLCHSLVRSELLLNKVYKCASRWGMRDQERNERCPRPL